MFSMLSNVFKATNVVVTDFTSYPDDNHFYELFDMLRPQILGGKVINGEVKEIKYKEISLPKKWINEINAVAKELDFIANENNRLPVGYKKNEGEIPEYYALRLKQPLVGDVPVYGPAINRISNCLGKVNKVTVKTVAISYRAYFAAFDKELLNAFMSLNKAHNKFKISIGKNYFMYTPIDPLENLMAEKILTAVHTPIINLESFDRYMERFRKYGMEDLEDYEVQDYESVSKYCHNAGSYFDYNELYKQWRLLAYCVAKEGGKRANIESCGEEYLESLFDEFGLPHKLDVIPFL